MLLSEELIGKILIEKNMTLSVAESCTGGLISSKLTDISGSSQYIKFNFVTYSDEAKNKFLGVSKETLEVFGAVSEQTAIEMAQGMRKTAETDISLSITGIAGPTGGSIEKPVGLAYIAISDAQKTQVYKINANSGLSRIEIKNFAANRALELLCEFLSN
jgi:PncC family amidohydrolase